jgi:putative RecB family exonuclease
VISTIQESPNDVAERLTGRSYVSWSQINAYRSCPLRYFYRYIEQLPEQTVSSALVFGSAIHGAIEFWFREWLAGNPDPDLDMLLDAYQTEWRDRDTNAVKFGKKEDVNSLGDLAERMLTVFMQDEASRPDGQIIGIEEQLQESVIEGCPDLLARLDLLIETDDAVVVTDFKTSRSRWSQEQADQAGEQLLLYSELVKHLVPTKPLRLEFVVLTKTKSPSIETYTVAIDQQRVDRSRKTVERVWRGIESGLFFPSPSMMNCPSCPFREPCQAWRG